MNEELQKQLTDLLVTLSSSVQRGAEWVGEQVPPLVQEKILLGRIEETTWFVGGLIVAVVLVYKGARFWKRSFELTDEYDAPVCVVPFLAFGAALLAATVNLHSFVLVWFAPRLYIVEWLADLMRRNG